MLYRPRSAFEKSKNTLKITHNLIWRPNGASDGKSYKKSNDLHEIPYLECGLRFQFRPTVHPQFTKIGGATGEKKSWGAQRKLFFREFFFGIFAIFWTYKHYFTKKNFRNIDSKWVKMPTKKSKNGK